MNSGVTVTPCCVLPTSTVGGRAVATADYTLDERDSHLVSTTATVDELADGTPLSTLLVELVDGRPAGHEAVVDLYVHWGDLPRDQEQASARLAERLAGMSFASGHASTHIPSPNMKLSAGVSTLVSLVNALAGSTGGDE